MPRYIQEIHTTLAGGTFTIPTCSKFLGVEKISNHFVIIFEVWGNPSLVFDIDLHIFRKDEYIRPEAKYIGYAVVGEQIFHFAYTSGKVEDLGGDGGAPPADGDEPMPEPKSMVPEILAGGMKEL